MFIELTESGVEKCQIICIRGYRCQRLAGPCRAATNSGVDDLGKRHSSKEKRCDCEC
jgi:hypothetical protein